MSQEESHTSAAAGHYYLLLPTMKMHGKAVSSYYDLMFLSRASGKDGTGG
jgi:hypothetical protein